jgi:hypothetical protein
MGLAAEFGFSFQKISPLVELAPLKCRAGTATEGTVARLWERGWEFVAIHGSERVAPLLQVTKTG